MASNAPQSASERAASYRSRKRASGYRLTQRWVPNLADAAVAAMIDCHCRAIAAQPSEAEDQAYIDFIADRDGG